MHEPGIFLSTDHDGPVDAACCAGVLVVLWLESGDQ